MRSLPAAAAHLATNAATRALPALLLGVAFCVGPAAGCGEKGAAAPPAASPGALASTQASSSAPASSPHAEPAAAPEAPPEPPSPSEVAAHAVGALRDAFNAHDADKVADQYTPDCVVETYTGPALHGRGEVAEDARKTFAAFRDAKAAPLRGWVKDHVVISEVAWTGTMGGEYMGVKATSKPVG